MLSNDLQELSLKQLLKTLKALEEAGMTPNMLAFVRSDKAIAVEIVNLLIDKMMPYKADQELFSCFRSEEFFGLSDWKKYYRLNLPEDISLPIPIVELEKIMNSTCPFNRDKKVRETHFLFYLPANYKKEPVSIKKLMEIFPKDSDPRFYQYLDKYNGCKRKLYDTCVTRYEWLLMYKGVIPNSSNKSFSEQLALKPKGYEVPKLIESTAMHFLLFKKNKLRVDETKWGRTCDTGAIKVSHFSAGGFSEEGYSITMDEKDDARESNLGIYFFRKLEKV